MDENNSNLRLMIAINQFYRGPAQAWGRNAMLQVEEFLRANCSPEMHCVLAAARTWA